MGIYLDNAATSYPKPEEVYKAVEEVMRNIGGSPGRAGHRMALEANRIIFKTREIIGELFNIEDSSNIIFTSNATEALNIGIKGILREGDHVITSSIEHNSVTRPLKSLEVTGKIYVTKVMASKEGYINPKEIESSINNKTKMIILTHASNVIGGINPIEEIGEIARRKNIIFMIDAAQTAGILPIYINRLNVDLIACPGHKSLYGPQGTGFLYIKEGLDVKPLIEGGTGGNSESESQPEDPPERYESGTMNTPGIAGLMEGIRFILKESVNRIRKYEEELTIRFIEGLKRIKNVTIYGPDIIEERVPLVSFNINGYDPSFIGYILDTKYDISVRAGLHCSPDAHKTIGSFPYGTVRVSFSYFNRLEDVEYALMALREISTS
jgi:cysteine desulfurase family protein